jgi:outer membrane lipoprotein SlyB
MRKAIWIVIVSLVVAPLQALEQHPLKVWLQQNKGQEVHRSVDEKKAASQARKNAITGAVMGGLLLGLRAAVRHEDIAQAIVVGAAAGAVAGYVVGKMEDRQIADRNQLEQRMAYDPSQGVVAAVTRMDCDPCRVKPGQTFNITVSYYAMRPEHSALTISRHLGLAVGGSYVRVFTFDPDPFTMADGGGEFETTLAYTIPAEAKEGTYTMDWLVESDQASIEKAGSANIVVSNAA